MALVPFSYSSPFADPLKLDERIFDVAGNVLKIRQRYLPDGKGGTSLGFGASVYSAAFVLAHYLSLHRELVEDKLVLELGCGTGLTSIAAAMLGCKAVIATDGGDESLQLTAENAERNLTDEIVASRLTVAPLFWGNDEHLGDIRRRIRQSRIDDIQSRPQEMVGDSTSSYGSSTEHDENCSPDLILAADVAALPYQEAYQALVDTLSALSTSRTRILLVYQQRHASEQRFFRKMTREFDVRPLDQAASIHPDFHHLPITMFEIRKRGQLDVEQSAKPSEPDNSKQDQPMPR